MPPSTSSRRARPLIGVLFEIFLRDVHAAGAVEYDQLLVGVVQRNAGDSAVVAGFALVVAPFTVAVCAQLAHGLTGQHAVADGDDAVHLLGDAGIVADTIVVMPISRVRWRKVS